MRQLIKAEDSDIYDVLEYVAFAVKPISRMQRVDNSRDSIFVQLNDKQKDFVGFVLEKYIESGVDELSQEKLPDLLTLKYHSMTDAAEKPGGVDIIKETFIGFQKYLYQLKSA